MIPEPPLRNLKLHSSRTASGFTAVLNSHNFLINS